MTIQESLLYFESLLPAIVGASIGVLALIGIKELFKETKVALNKRISA